MLIGPITNVCYRRQWSCSKVMFLHLSVSHSVHWGVSARHPPPLGRHPPGQTSPRADTLLGRQPPLPTTATAADCTRPTGMLSCLHISYWSTPEKDPWFPKREAPTLKGGANLLFSQIFWKLHKKEENCTVGRVQNVTIYIRHWTQWFLLQPHSGQVLSFFWTPDSMEKLYLRSSHRYFWFWSFPFCLVYLSETILNFFFSLISLLYFLLINRMSQELLQVSEKIKERNKSRSNFFY